MDAERAVGIEFFAVNFPRLNWHTEFYWWMTAPKFYGMNYGAEYLDALQAKGAKVVLLFDAANFDFVFNLVLGPDNRLRWEYPDYGDEHAIGWAGYQPGDCLAKARAHHILK